MEKLLEKLAEFEHEQWVSWSKNVVDNYEIPDFLLMNWTKNWIPYSELSEEMKEKDRKWARKVLKIVRD